MAVAAYFAQPAAEPVEDVVPEAEREAWTRDMDDMLRMIVRQRKFDFAQASVQMQRYILQVCRPCPLRPPRGCAHACETTHRCMLGIGN